MKSHTVVEICASSRLTGLREAVATYLRTALGRFTGERNHSGHVDIESNGYCFDYGLQPQSRW